MPNKPRHSFSPEEPADTMRPDSPMCSVKDEAACIYAEAMRRSPAEPLAWDPDSYGLLEFLLLEPQSAPAGETLH